MADRGHIDALVSELSGVGRENAWHSLAELGPVVAPDVIAILQTIDEPTVAVELIRLLAEYRSLEAIPFLVGRLRDPKRDVWQAALDALVTIGTVQSAEALTAAAATRMPEDRQEWISEALDQIREDAQRVPGDS
jgi:HEAT repeat protein